MKRTGLILGIVLALIAVGIAIFLLISRIGGGESNPQPVAEDPFSGIGKPEPLKGELSGYWSRRIDDEHRLIYRANTTEVKILKARYHY